MQASPHTGEPGTGRQGLALGGWGRLMCCLLALLLYWFGVLGTLGPSVRRGLCLDPTCQAPPSITRPPSGPESGDSPWPRPRQAVLAAVLGRGRHWARGRGWSSSSSSLSRPFRPLRSDPVFAFRLLTVWLRIPRPLHFLSEIPSFLTFPPSGSPLKCLGTPCPGRQTRSPPPPHRERCLLGPRTPIKQPASTSRDACSHRFPLTPPTFSLSTQQGLAAVLSAFVFRTFGERPFNSLSQLRVASEAVLALAPDVCRVPVISESGKWPFQTLWSSRTIRTVLVIARLSPPPLRCNFFPSRGSKHLFSVHWTI